MSEMISNGFFTDSKGNRLEVVDANARKRAEEAFSKAEEAASVDCLRLIPVLTSTFTATGQDIRCHPVENTEMQVIQRFAAYQEGEPAPDHILPIHPIQSVGMIHESGNGYAEYTQVLKAPSYGGAYYWHQGMIVDTGVHRILNGKEWGVDGAGWGLQSGADIAKRYFYLNIAARESLDAPDNVVENGAIMSHFPNKPEIRTSNEIQGFRFYNVRDGYTPYARIVIRPNMADFAGASDAEILQNWKNWLANQEAQGTPVEIAYRLMNGIGQREYPEARILGGQGENRLYIDFVYEGWRPVNRNDALTVSGYLDPVYQNEQQEERISALEESAIGGGGGGTSGEDGGYYIPSVSSSGVLSWAATKDDMPAVPSADIKGPQGKSAYQYAQEGGYTGSESDFAAKLANENTLNPLYGKKVSFLGDSICAGSNESTSYLGGYGKIIADRNSMAYENLAVGGSVITAETYSGSTGNPLTWLCRLVDNMSADADYAIVEGGVNDAWRYIEGKGDKLGAITEGYNATLDDTTFCGAFESMLKKLVTRFQGKKIGYIAIPKTSCNMYDSERNAPNFYHIAMQCCAKWGVPVCDLNTITPSFAFLKSLGSTYTADGTHPTYEGYIKYFCDPIEAWMKSLTTGSGSVTSLSAKNAIEIKEMRESITALQTGKLNREGVSFRRALLPLADGTTLEIDVLTALDGNLVIPFTNRVPSSIDTTGSVFNGTGYKTGYRLSSNGAEKESTYSAVTGFIPAKAGDVIRITGCGWYKPTAASYLCAYNSDFSFIGAVTSNKTKYGTQIYSSVDVAGVIASVTLADVANIAYIRVSAANDGGEEYDQGLILGADMIVTVNEEIA